MEESLLKKKQKLRNNEYYGMQNTFDELYRQSSNSAKFRNLLEIIMQKENILLAYRNIKTNKGSMTEGTDERTIEFFESMEVNEFVEYIQDRFIGYTPKSVRRVEIKKENGKIRPLGIPCMEDRIIQQCILQIVEPICEAKFHTHSYGFRPNKSTEHAIARSMFLVNISKLHYVVDVDIRSFFDNVNHGKLKRQMWNLGIQDTNLISIIGKILKSEIQGTGIPIKGTPQGGIISPILSNIVLNELDWWISSQWETFETKYEYATSCKYRAMKNSNLKEIWIVRYADDFKIFCRDYKTAQKIFVATKQWLKERLDLEISPEKSQVTNLRRNYTEFLGFKLRVVEKEKKQVVQSRMCDKAVKATVNKLKSQIKRVQRHTNPKEVNRLNAIILGSHNYYNKASMITQDFSNIDFLVRRTLYNRLRGKVNNKPKFTKTYNKLYGNYKGKIITICEICIFPIYGCRNKPPMNISNKICGYTVEGRKSIHDNLQNYQNVIEHLIENQSSHNSVEFNDNRISLMAGQQGKCYVTGRMLRIGNMECHHRKPKHQNGTDEYKNLVWLEYNVHKLIHCTEQNTINKYLEIVNLSDKGLKCVNSLRKLVGNSII